MPRFLTSRYFLWFVLALPGLWMVSGYASGRLYYGEVVHSSGEWSIRLMILAMAATPLLLMFPGRGLPRWLMRRRRAFGVSAFAYALLHTVVYLDRTAVLAEVLSDGAELAYATGWLALGIFAALAVTSNDASVRRLRLWWRKLHRLVYAAAILGFAHWVLVAFDPLAAWVHAGLLGVLEAIRVWLQGRIRRRSRAAS